MNAGAPRPLEIASAKQVAAEALRTMIYDGTLELGSKVSIEGIARQFGMSRTPVRDALWQLSAEGLVSIAPRVGVTIRPIAMQEIAEVYAIKLAIEPLVARWATERSSRSERAALEDVHHDFTVSVENGDVSAYLAAVVRCRTMLIGLADSDPARGVFLALDGRLRLIRRRNLTSSEHFALSAGEYRGVVRATIAGDGDAAFALMRDHVMKAQQRAFRVNGFDPT